MAVTDPESEHRRRPNAGRQAGERSHSFENLALLYQGLLAGIVRLQARRQHITDAETFRRRTKAALEEVQRAAAASGYDGRDVKDTHFAVIALLDAVVLHSNDPIRAEWERKTLQEDLFGQTDAGVVFFDRLQAFRSRADSAHLADILEVFLLCLLLGFEGRYSGGLRGELNNITEKVKLRIDDIRGRRPQISPAGALPPEPPPAPPARRRGIRFGTLTLAALLVTLVWFLVLKLNLVWFSDQVGSRLS